MSVNLNFFHYKDRLVNKKNFQAGNLALEKYISNNMSQFEEQNMSRNYVGIDSNDNFVSVLCLSASTIKSDEKISDNSYPLHIEKPTIKIGRLVVDKRYRGNGYGTNTLQKAISIFVEVSKRIGSIGLTVDAKLESVDFYKKFGFINFSSADHGDYTPMILTTTDLKKIRPSLFEDPV